MTECNQFEQILILRNQFFNKINEEQYLEIDEIEFTGNKYQAEFVFQMFESVKT